MPKSETTKQPALPDELDMERSYLTNIKVSPTIQVALNKHRRDLPELMKGHANEWLAYRGEERLEFGRSKRALYNKYLDRGLNLDELVVLGAEPEMPDEIELHPSEWAQV
jgi:hypothetical protein